MTWVTVVSGCLGAALGGLVSDRLCRRFPPIVARLIVLACSNIVAAPLAAAVILVPDTRAFAALFFANVFGEMWMGVTLAVVMHLTPVRQRGRGRAWRERPCWGTLYFLFLTVACSCCRRRHCFSLAARPADCRRHLFLGHFKPYVSLASVLDSPGLFPLRPVPPTSPLHPRLPFHLVGGNANVLVTPIQRHLSLSHTLLVLFPGMYLLGGLGFAALLYRCMKAGAVSSDAESAPLLQ